MATSRPRIVIVGGGFAGAKLTRLLQKRARFADVTLVSEESYTTFNPMLAEVVGATVFPEHVVAPLRETVGHARFVMGTVGDVDFAGKRLRCDTLKGSVDLDYDHLVLAFGNRARVDLIAGMAEHAVVLKTVGDAMHIRNLVLRRLAQIELETDPGLRRCLGHFVVVGGGFSGVEVAGAVADSLREIRRYYPGVRAEELRVTLLQNVDRLLVELPASLGEAAERSLRKRGVAVMTMTGATAVGARELTLNDGQVLSAATTICTIGTMPNALAARLTALATERGRIVCNADLSVAGIDDIWAIGDCALIQNGADGFAPPTAQFAVAEAKHLSGNLIARIQHRATKPFAYRARGMMATVGHLKGVASVFGIDLSGLPAWLLWRAYYLCQMPTLGRKLRIFVEWSWGMFFPPDITHFRFTRSHDLLESDRAGVMPSR
ncbi:MAG: NAD(P)/FAD-dependent oxidoreductase [Gammaproteobacteria bacterium]|nr:MAG: NAD(P)/FAD-dependent oxidoreductase [Gammaproteobacteria bacterium]